MNPAKSKSDISDLWKEFLDILGDQAPVGSAAVSVVKHIGAWLQPHNKRRYFFWVKIRDIVLSVSIGGLDSAVLGENSAPFLVGNP